MPFLKFFFILASFDVNSDSVVKEQDIKKNCVIPYVEVMCPLAVLCYKVVEEEDKKSGNMVQTLLLKTFERV